MNDDEKLPKSKQEALLMAWESFGDTAINEDEEIEEDFHIFSDEFHINVRWEKGTDRIYIWRWFDENLEGGLVGDAMQFLKQEPGPLFAASDKTVADRVEKIDEIARAYYDQEDEAPTQAAEDMMADILHFLASHNVNLTDAFERALMHFHGERDEDGMELYPYIDTDPEPDESGLTREQIEAFWSRQDWIEEVAEGNTKRGYEDWVTANHDQKMEDDREDYLSNFDLPEPEPLPDPRKYFRVCFIDKLSESSPPYRVGLYTSQTGAHQAIDSVAHILERENFRGIVRRHIKGVEGELLDQPIEENFLLALLTGKQ